MSEDDVLIHAYLDGEMDVQQTLAFEQRLAADARLRERAGELRDVSAAIRETAQYYQAPAAIMEMLARSAMHAPPAAASRAPRASGGWVAGTVRVLGALLDWRPAFAPVLGFAAVAVVATNMLLVRVADETRLEEELVSSHVRAMLMERPVDVLSSDHHTVKPYLSARLDFSPPVREITLPGAQFVGGRVDYIAGRRVAVLVYRQGNHLVDDYVWPAPGARGGAHTRVVNGFRVAEWSDDGMAHRLVSDVGEAELEAIVRNLRGQ